METFSGIILGIIQGLTEFLPISSSGHLVLFQHLLGLRGPELLLDIALHLGTLLSICIYLRSELRRIIVATWKTALGFPQIRKSGRSLGENPDAVLALMVLIGTLPTGLMGIFFRSPIENLFGSVTMVGIALLITGLILAVSRLVPEDYSNRRQVGTFMALLIGTAQGIALVPGISRSGSTIVCGLVCGLKREEAARFSFLLAIPAIIGATVLQLTSEGLSKGDLIPLFFGFVSSALMGLVALKILMGVVKRGSLFYFAPYCWLLGVLIIWV